MKLNDYLLSKLAPEDKRFYICIDFWHHHINVYGVSSQVRREEDVEYFQQILQEKTGLLAGNTYFFRFELKEIFVPKVVADEISFEPQGIVLENAYFDCISDSWQLEGKNKKFNNMVNAIRTYKLFAEHFPNLKLPEIEWEVSDGCLTVTHSGDPDELTKDLPKGIRVK